MTRRPNPLGDLLRARRQATRTGFKQLEAATGLEDETMRKWETGDTYDVPLRGALLYARAVGITLDELVEAALGESWPSELRATEAAEEALAEAQALLARARELLGPGKDQPGTHQSSG